MTPNSDAWVRGEDAAWAARDVERILSFYAQDCVYEDLAAGKHLVGHAAIRTYLEDAFAGIPDFSVQINSYFTNATRVCNEGLMRGTHTGVLTGLSPAASGRTFAVRYAHVCELREGLAVRITDYYDMVTLLRQLGSLS